ncbi:MocR-like pyridoxine biosynthesis transcription factor PdxR [Paracoccus aminophilus]|uniref:Transcriptional regulator, GntR family n=1 Tax=Paracoccus aminophilus JCM 7686 TaxID=1367847 RepID=S5YPE8_PARAH|nr:PLP-dependent aminotransferase family protein [Paracoccus aminophilus]AGT07186.1 transcriptional regulator, GntR family [Paracoccus aminophilus JCM 7686]
MAIAAELFFLDPASAATLQHQLRQQIVEAILDRRFLTGERLPSSRELARHLGISRLTVATAYADLMAQGFLSSRDRSGYFIAEGVQSRPAAPPTNDAEQRADWSRLIGQRFSTSRGRFRNPEWRSYRYPFIYGQADPALFDLAAWRQCSRQALGQSDFNLLTADFYEADDPELVLYITRHLLPRRGIHARPEEVLLTLGAQNALWLSAQVLLNQRRTAVIENPCYPGLRQIVEQTRCHVRPLDVDAEGLPPDQIPQGTDVVFTTASHQCPTNTTMSLARRRDLLERAQHEGFAIVEDDYEFEMSFTNAPSPALKSLDRAESVIYVGSFSKSLFPGLRLGYLVGPTEFLAEARALRALVLRHPPGHLQRTVAYFLSLGHADRQMEHMRRVYAERRAVMEEAIARHRLEIAGAGSGAGGSSFWMRTPPGIDTTRLAQDLLAQDVVIEPGPDFFFDPEPQPQHYRLAYSSIPSERIAEGIARISGAIERAKT